MPQQQARVTSIEAIDLFRASLITYLDKTRVTVDDITGEVMRTRLWLQDVQRPHWEREVRRRTKTLEEAQQSLFSAQISNLRAVSTGEQLAVRRAKAALEEAQQKLASVKRWTRDFDGRVEPVARQLNRLGGFLAKSLPEAVLLLGNTVRTLDAYSGTKAPGEPASGEENAAGDDKAKDASA